MTSWLIQHYAEIQVYSLYVSCIIGILCGVLWLVFNKHVNKKNRR